MANGGWFTDEEWVRVERPLIAIDPMIEQFALSTNLPVEKNLKDWPGRSMSWGHEVRCLIQIYLADEKELTWNIWLCCSHDVQNERFWRREFLIEKKPVSEFQTDLPKLLRVGHERLSDWSKHPENFEFATKLAI